MTLKTLKDLIEESDRPEMVEPEELRQSAIDDIKELQKEDIERDKKEESGEWSVVGDSSNKSAVKYIKEKFNITEDDLK